MNKKLFISNELKKIRFVGTFPTKQERQKKLINNNIKKYERKI